MFLGCLQTTESFIARGLGPPFGLSLWGVGVFPDRGKSSLSLAYKSFRAGMLEGGVMIAGVWGTTPPAFFARSAMVAR